MSYKWYWMNDNGWTLFDAKKTADLEKGYLAKAKSVTLDKERFVDLSLSFTEICKNFTNLTDKAMVGIQRRFDDHNRRRAVKREKDTTSFFDGLEFAFLAQLQGVTMKAKDKDMVNNVKTYGGKVVTSLSKTVDYLVVTGTTPPDACAETMTAESLKIPIVYASFITKCILDGQLVDHKSSIVPVKAKKKVDDKDEEEEGEEGTKKKKTSKKKVKGEDEEGEGEGEEEEAPKKKKATKKKGKGEDDEEEEEEKPKKKGDKKKKKDEEEEEEEKPKKKGKDDKKRKAESDEEEEEEPKKKVKVDKDDKKANGNTTTTTTTTSSTIKGTKGAKGVSDVKEVKAPVKEVPVRSAGSTLDGLQILQPGTDWMGVCTDTAENTHYPFLLQILKIENTSFEGFIFWKTLNDAQTKIRGRFAPNGNGGDLDVDIEEYEAIKGEDELELPMKYSGVLSGKSISGRVGDKDSKSTFKVDLIKSVPFKVHVPTTWNGTCKTEMPFELKIATRTDDELTGTIEWKTTPLTITKWRGKISGLNMTVEEHEVVKGDEEFMLRTWNLAVTQDETLEVKTVDNETLTVFIK